MSTVNDQDQDPATAIGKELAAIAKTAAAVFMHLQLQKTRQELANLQDHKYPTPDPETQKAWNDQMAPKDIVKATDNDRENYGTVLQTTDEKALIQFTSEDSVTTKVEIDRADLQVVKPGPNNTPPPHQTPNLSQTPPTPKQTQTQAPAQAQAQAQAQAGQLPTPRPEILVDGNQTTFKPGDPVRAKDKKNVGTVKTVNGNQIQVHFHNKKTGQEKIVEFKPHQLQLRKQTNTPTPKPEQQPPTRPTNPQTTISQKTANRQPKPGNDFGR